MGRDAERGEALLNGAIFEGVAPLAEKALPNNPPVRLAPFGYEVCQLERKGSNEGSVLPRWVLNCPHRYSLTVCTGICLELDPKMVWCSLVRLFYEIEVLNQKLNNIRNGTTHFYTAEVVL